jgi:hypothetical protein
MPGFFIRRDIGAPTQYDVSATDEFSRVHRFFLINFLGLQPNQFPWHFIKDLTVPEKDIESLDIPTAGAVYKFPKQVKYGDAQIVWYGTPELELKLIKMAENKTHNDKEGTKNGTNLIEIGLTDSQGELTLRHKLYNCWISSIKRSELTYTSSEFLYITAVIKLSHYKTFSGWGDYEGDSVLDLPTSVP